MCNLTKLFLSVLFWCNISFVLISSLVWAGGSSCGSNCWRAASCSQEDVQDAITNHASNGWTVQIPAGNCAWTSFVSFTDKNIAIIGAGIGKTNITANNVNKLFYIRPYAKGAFRISGISFSGSNISSVFNIDAAGATGDPQKGWRFDHLSFDFNYTTTNIFVVQGVTWGLIDNCIFTGSTAGHGILTTSAYRSGESSLTPPNSGYYAHSLPLNMGSDEAIYFEDNTVNFGTTTGYISNEVYGGNIVIRYNNITGTYIQNHSARGSDRGGVLYEIYNNTLTGAGKIWPANLRSGTGVIFNNTVTSYSTNHFIIDNQRTCLGGWGSTLDGRCDGTNAYDGNTSGEYGWPCVDQIGWVGDIGSQTNVPLYGWNNGSDATCATGGACNNAATIAVAGPESECISDQPPSAYTVHLKTKGDAFPHTGDVVDYINNGSTPKPGYTPYTYPHPLRGANKGATIINTIGGLNAINMVGGLNVINQ